MTERAQSSIFQRLRQDLAAAFLLLTRFPVTWDKYSPEAPNLNRSLWAYPVIGLVVGLVGAGFYTVADRAGLPDMVAVLCALISMIFATGAFHEDGLADVADGFGGGQTRDRKLEIMRDSQIGTYGGLALILSFGLRVGCIEVMTSSQVVIALIVAAMISRLMIVTGLFILVPARSDSLATETGKPKMIMLGAAALLTGGMMVALLGGGAAFWAALAAFSGFAIMAWIAMRQIGGYTGDVLGAIQQISEIAVLIALCIYWGGS
jgi:adenosylcobinamide-GDP ribazoletransferase